MDKSIELSLEQEFHLRFFESQVQKMTHQQAQEFLVNLYEQMMMRETIYKNFLRHQWGLETSPNFE